MKIKENVTLYICEYCKKRYLIKYACISHELYCNDNPENRTACSGCLNCQETKKDYIQHGNFDGYDIEEGRQANAFHCSVKDVGIYPVKVIKKGLLKRYPESFVGDIQMPKECDQAKYIEF